MQQRKINHSEDTSLSVLGLGFAGDIYIYTYSVVERTPPLWGTVDRQLLDSEWAGVSSTQLENRRGAILPPPPLLRQGLSASEGTDPYGSSRAFLLLGVYCDRNTSSSAADVSLGKCPNKEWRN